MGDFDIANRMVAHYPHFMRNRKFYVRIAFHFMSVAGINSWIFNRETNDNKMPLLELNVRITDSLYETHKKRGGPTKEYLGTPFKKRATTKIIHEICVDEIGDLPNNREL